MMKSSIEITDTQYLIRLNKDEFAYAKLKSFMAHLLSDQTIPLQAEEWDDDKTVRQYMEHGDRFDYLGDK